jgi:hypothetical protein
MGYYLKDPASSLDYVVDWQAGLGSARIVSSSWSVVPNEPSGIALAASLREDTRTAATLAGGVTGRVYRIGNRIERDDGNVDERAITIRVERR